MKTSSRKAKGRLLQKYVLELLVKAFGFTEDDVRSAIMGETGADVKLSRKAKRKFPYEIECKNQEIFSNVYKAYDQAKSHGPDEPLVVIKMNRRKPLAILDFETFLKVSNDRNSARKTNARRKTR
jgi:hypothetical protein